LAALDLPRQLAALEAVRTELETALGGDENWRALRGAGAVSGAASPERRERDARLIKALEANPLYLAWTNVAEAIEALQDADSALDAYEHRQKHTPDRKLATIPSVAPADGPGTPLPEPVAAAADAKPKAYLPPFRTAEPAEAKVSFVRRQTPSGAANVAAGAEAKAAAGSDAFVPAAGSAEEAEVAIVSAPVRRFLKALSGD
jgi:hypothetical protein